MVDRFMWLSVTLNIFFLFLQLDYQTFLRNNLKCCFENSNKLIRCNDSIVETFKMAIEKNGIVFFFIIIIINIKKLKYI